MRDFLSHSFGLPKTSTTVRSFIACSNVDEAFLAVNELDNVLTRDNFAVVLTHGNHRVALGRGSWSQFNLYEAFLVALARNMVKALARNIVKAHSDPPVLED